MNFKPLPFLLLTALAWAEPSAEQKVFGTPPAAKGQPSKPSAKAADNTFGQQSQNQAKQAKMMYDRFVSGDMSYAGKLKDAANAGNRWASLQYGVLAQKGKLPGLKGPDYALAQRAYLKAVKNTDGSLTANYLAAYNLGVLYYNGAGGKKDPASALRWFQTAITAYRELRKSKTAVLWPASAYAAQILTRGAGVKADKTAARTYWLEAVKGGEPSTLYAFGLTVYSENPFTAIGYFRRAADRLYVPAMVAQARWYANSDKFHDADPVQAASWLLRAAHYDKSQAQSAASVMARLNVQSQKKAQQSAVQWLKSKGLKPQQFDFTQPLNEEPSVIR